MSVQSNLFLLDTEARETESAVFSLPTNISLVHGKRLVAYCESLLAASFVSLLFVCGSDE